MNGVVRKNTFGASAQIEELQTKGGLTPEAVVGFAKARLAASAAG